MDKIHKFIIIFVLILLVVIFVYLYTNISVNRYIIKNNYYGFQIETPKNWIAERDSFYTEENINEILNDCANDKKGLALYKIGSFKFLDQKKISDFKDSNLLPKDIPSGAFLTIEINCIPSSVSDKIIDYNFSNIKIGGEKAFQTFFNSLIFGPVKHFSFIYNRFQYKIEQYVYVSPEEKLNEEKIRDNYSKIFDNIVSSFSFVNF